MLPPCNPQFISLDQKGPEFMYIYSLQNLAATTRSHIISVLAQKGPKIMYI